MEEQKIRKMELWFAECCSENLGKFLTESLLIEILGIKFKELLKKNLIIFVLGGKY